MRSKCQETGFEQKIPKQEIIASLLFGVIFDYEFYMHLYTIEIYDDFFWS